MIKNGLLRLVIGLIIINLSSLFASANYYGNQDKVITVRGSSKLGHNKQQAKTQAITDAFEKALVSKIEKIISREKFSLHYKPLNDFILKKSSKFIKRFVIKKQTSETDSYEVEIDLSIDEIKLKEALAAIGLLFNESDYYKGLLLLSVKSTQDVAPDFWWSEKKLSKFNKMLISNLINQPNLTDPILKVDPFMLSFENKIPKNLSKLHLSHEEIQVIGKILGIDIVFYGSVVSSLNDTNNEKPALTINSSLQAINVLTGRRLSIGRLSKNVILPEKDIIKFEYNIIRDLAINNLKKSTEDIVASWINGTFNSTSYKIVFKGIISFAEYSMLKYFLKNDVNAVNSVEDYVLSKSKKVVNVESNESLTVIKENIEKATIENFQINVLPVKEEDTLEIQLMRL